MADRTDIDALLISALYGELTPADEARLTAHLESHPADRSALAELTQTRATVRDSRLFAVQLEPPQSVSAMLLREAARRAPREREDAGWFHRFVRSFMAHPAMAAAAMLVLVVGVAGTLYVRHGDPFVAPQLSERDMSVAQPAAPQAMPTGAAAPAAEPAAAMPDPAAPAPPDSVASAGSASFRVGLSDDDEAKADRALGKQQPRAQADQTKEAKDLSDGLAEPAPTLAQPAIVATKPSKKGSGGIEVRSRELAPKDFDEDNKLVVRPSDQGMARFEARAANEQAELGNAAKAERGRGGYAGPAGGAATPAPISALTTSAQDAPGASDPAAVPAAAPTLFENAKAKAPAPAKTVARSNSAPGKAAPPPPPSPTFDAESERQDRRAVDKAPVEEKSAEAKLLAWAEQQHKQVVALVTANKCREAASAAIAIYNRAPDYYAASVATNRSIKPCLAYVTTEREREDRSRAAKRAKATESPPAAPPRK